MNAKSGEDKLEVAIKLKRRYQNVFSESVDASASVKKTPAMAKDSATTAFLVRALRQNFVFASLDEAEVARVAEYCERKAVAKHAVLIRQGEQGDFFYVVEDGRFECSVDGARVQSVAAGGSFGELALLYGAPRAATVAATAPAVVWRIDRATFRSTVASGASRQKRRVTEALGTVGLLEGLTDDQLERVADAVQIVRYPAGKRVIQKGESGNVFYMIQDGAVDCTEVGGSNQFKDLVLRSGEYFGERALLTDQLRAAHVTAKTDVTLLALDREAFVRVLGPLRKVLDDNLSMRVLSSVEILSKMSAKERRRAAALFREKSYRAGEHVIRQGDAGEEFFVVKTGAARVEVAAPGGGAPRVVSEIEPGNYFGEMALLTNDVRTASIVAATDVECFVLARRDFVTAFGSLQAILERSAKKRNDELADGAAAGALSDVKLADLRVKAALGAGTFGRVKLVHHAATDQTYALKTMHKSEVVRHAQVTNVLNEKQLMLLCVHPFVLRLHATYMDKDRLYLLLEFVQGGELFSVLHTPRADGVPEAHARFYGAGVCAALAAIHEKNVAYRDLKPENIMVDGRGYPKIVDFGFAKVVARKTYTLCGTPEYLAPEIVLGRGHNKCVDWWAFGVLVYEMIAGYSPFADPVGSDQVVICKNIINGKLVFPKKFSREAQDLCRKLLHRAPVDRLGAHYAQSGVADHKWFGPVDADKLLAYGEKAPWIPRIKSALDCSNFEPYEGNDDLDPGYRDDPALWAGFCT